MRTGTITNLTFPVTPSEAPDADYEVANKKYVDDNGGGGMLEEDTTVNLTSALSSAEIQALIDAQPKNLNGYTLTFQFADGTYTLSETLLFKGFYSGKIEVFGNSSDNSLGTTKSVVLNFGAGISYYAGLRFENCLCEVQAKYLEITAAAAAYVIYAYSVFFFYGEYNYILGAGTAASSGVKCQYVPSALLFGNYVSNVKYGIEAAYSTVMSNTNDDTGTAPLYGLYSNSVATIGKNSTQPAGSTGNELTASAGIIR